MRPWRSPSVGSIAAFAYYTLELTRPAGGWTALPELTAAARGAADRLRREGVDVRFVRVVFVPEDDACFYLYRAASAGAVQQAADLAALSIESIQRPGEAAMPQPISE